METRQLRVIPEPRDGPQFAPEPGVPLGGPFIKGQSGTSFVCGSCGKLLVETVQPGQVMGIVFLCECGAYNRSHD